MLEAVQLTGTVLPLDGPAVTAVGGFSVPTEAVAAPLPIPLKYAHPPLLCQSTTTSELPTIRRRHLTTVSHLRRGERFDQLVRLRSRLAFLQLSWLVARSFIVSVPVAVTDWPEPGEMC